MQFERFVLPDCPPGLVLEAVGGGSVQELDTGEPECHAEVVWHLTGLFQHGVDHFNLILRGHTGIASIISLPDAGADFCGDDRGVGQEAGIFEQAVHALVHQETYVVSFQVAPRVDVAVTHIVYVVLAVLIVVEHPQVAGSFPVLLINLGQFGGVFLGGHVCAALVDLVEGVVYGVVFGIVVNGDPPVIVDEDVFPF